MEVETETEVEVTDSEAENEPAAAAAKSEMSESAEKNDSSARVGGDDDDILNVDCREEVDEFSQFLNDFESELNDSGNIIEKKPKSASGKKKKTKIVKKKKLVKRIIIKKRKSPKKTETLKTSLAPTASRTEDRASRSEQSDFSNRIKVCVGTRTRNPKGFVPRTLTTITISAPSQFCE